MTLINSEWHGNIFLMVNNNCNLLVKYSININYEYGKFLHFTSIINI